MIDSNELSSRERQVCLLFLEGFRGKEIAGNLGISIGTLKKHKTNIRNKLHANNDVAMGFKLASIFSRGDIKGVYLERLTILKPEGEGL